MNKKVLAVTTALFFILLLSVSLIRKSDPLLTDEGFGQFRSQGMTVTEEVQEFTPTVEFTEAEAEQIIEERRERESGFDLTPFDELQGLILVRNDECTMILETALPNEGIVDPRHSLYQAMQDELLDVTLEVISAFVSQPSQELYGLVYESVMEIDEFDPMFFKEQLDKAEVCYHSRGLTYLQVLMEAADMYQWSTPVRLRHGQIIMRILYDEIVNFPSSTNLVFALSTLRALGQSNFAITDEPEEISALLSRVIEQFERVSIVMAESTNDREIRSAFRDHLDENDILRQQIRDLISMALERSRF